MKEVKEIFCWKIRWHILSSLSCSRAICPDSRCPLTLLNCTEKQISIRAEGMPLIPGCVLMSICWVKYQCSPNTFYKSIGQFGRASMNHSARGETLPFAVAYCKQKMSELFIVSWWKAWTATLVYCLKGTVSVTVSLEFHTFGLKEGIRGQKEDVCSKIWPLNFFTYTFIA